ncbi:hypothetical protein PVK06_018828 [Gossypium arboreum]|uniref:Uncharacterized protein n=1 Tax=Gossypium arboreum TaxID=29729 RepID=A0ABR0PIB2_GOSAR|nr:hypothetical protein PVK06_018828 [Gossypium arboreum]
MSRHAIAIWFPVSWLLPKGCNFKLPKETYREWRICINDTPIVKVCYIGSVVKAFQQMELDKQQVKKANSHLGFTNQSNEVKGSIMLLATPGKENQASAYTAIFRRPLLKASKWP